MSFGEHLEELRSRIINALLGVAVCCIVTLWYGRDIIAWLCEPLFEVFRLAKVPTHMYVRSSMSGFGVYLKVSLIAGVVIATPWIIYQLWKFIEAGLYASERRAVMLIGPLSAVMTTLAILFTYYIFLPAALTFLIFFTTTYPVPEHRNDSFLQRVSEALVVVNNWSVKYIPGLESLQFGPKTTTQPATSAPPGESAAQFIVPVVSSDPPTPMAGQVWFNQTQGEMRMFDGTEIRMLSMTTRSALLPMIDPSDYINEVALLGLIIVFIFQIPVLMTFIGAVGLLGPAPLRKYRKYVVFGCFVGSVILTPSQDLFSNVALPVLMWTLFEIGLIFMGIAYRQHARSVEASEEVSQ